MIVMSCNVRYSLAKDGENDWPLRRELCTRVILSRNPDVVCFQETTVEQFDWFSRKMPGFASVAPTDRPAGGDPVNAIFWRTDRLAPIAAGAYWLSRTPHVPGTKSWASDCIRMVNWVRLAMLGGGTRDGGRQDAGTMPELRVVNTHLDHISQRARVHQAGMIAEDCAAYPAAYPQVLTGDFNGDHRNPAVGRLLRSGFRDTYEAVHGTADPFATYHAFRGRGYRGRIGKMDWVMARGEIRVRAAEVVTDSEAGRYPSDHFFVSAEIEPEPA